MIKKTELRRITNGLYFKMSACLNVPLRLFTATGCQVNEPLSISNGEHTNVTVISRRVSCGKCLNVMYVHAVYIRHSPHFDSRVSRGEPCLSSHYIHCLRELIIAGSRSVSCFISNVTMCILDIAGPVSCIAAMWLILRDQWRVGNRSPVTAER